MINVNEKRLNIILFIVSALTFTELYWLIYELIIDNLSWISIQATNYVDLIVIFVFILAFVPCSFGIKKLLILLLSKEPKQ